MPTESELDNARGVLRKDYWDDVLSLAAEARAQIIKGNLQTRDAVDEWVWQAVDGHERIIYTHKAIETLLFCEGEEDAIEEGLLDLSTVKSPSQIYCALAFYGMRGDVLSALEADIKRAERESATNGGDSEEDPEPGGDGSGGDE
jgi:hypothetical protein